MRPDRSDRDLAAELDAERASAEHWRRVARQRTESYEALKHRGVVRAALAAERLTRPFLEGAQTRWQRARERAERTTLSLAAPGRRATNARRSRLDDALRSLPVAPAFDPRRVTVVLIGGDTDAEDSPRTEGAAVVRVGSTVTNGSVPGRAVRQAIDSCSGDLVCLLRATTAPLDDAWLARLAAAVHDDVVAASAVLVHPRRSRRDATPYDLSVREAGIDVALVDGVPVARARGAGTAPDPGAAPVDVAGASCACLVIDRASMARAGGFPPIDDLDVAAIELCARLRERGGRIVAVPAVLAEDRRPVRTFRALREPVAPTSREWRGAIDRTGPALAGHEGSGGRTSPSFVVTVASPSRKVAHQWGDWHFACALTESLDRLGHDVLVQTADRADEPAGRMRDVHLVVRGLAPVRRTPGQRHVLWIISHPEDIEDAELDEADLVFVASPVFARHLRTRTSTPVEVLLQATDHRRFRPLPPDPDDRHAVTVVANTRDVLRPVVADALAAGLRPAIYGGGWRDLVDPRLVVADHVDNERLPVVYSSAGVVLNDHWRTMQAWGFVSNRLFDVLACGTPVITDPVVGVEELFDGGALEYHGADGLRDLVARVLADPTAAREQAARGRAAVLAAHTFDHRAAELVRAIERHTKSP